MNPQDRHRRASDLFARAVALPPDQRHLFIESECGNDVELQKEVLSLLTFDDGHSQLPESPLIDVSGSGNDMDDTSMVGRTIGRYHIEGRLGRGGMGIVWKAVDPLLDRRVALKLIPAHQQASANAYKRFLAGARAASGLDHPGIATVYDAGDDNGDIYIAMRLVDGQTLRERIEHGPLSPGETVRVGLAAAEALAFAHDHGVLHRDVTSNNIMISRNGDVFVVDFGLALRPDEPRLGATGRPAGTISYMAPELLAGEDGDKRSDIFALGVVLYEVITARLPFVGRTQAGVINEVVHGTPAPISTLCDDVPEHLERIILRALAKDPLERYQSAAELVAELRTLDPSGEPYARPRTGKQRFVVPAALVVAAVTAGLLFGPLSGGDQRNELDPRAAGITTTSLDAYRHYLEGEAFRYQWDPTNADVSYNRALSYDSTFAMAYMRLTRWGMLDKKRAAIENALRYADGATRKEQGLIRARAARLSLDWEQAIVELDSLVEVFPDDKEVYIERSLVYYFMAKQRGVDGGFRKTIDDLEKALEIDPRDKVALCNLASAYDAIGDVDSAIIIADRYVEVAPDDANSYRTAGEFYATKGKLGEAIAVYEKGLSIDPSFEFSLQWLGFIYLFNNQFEKARETFTRSIATGTPYRRMIGRMFMAFIPLYQGKLDEAENALEKAMAADEMEGEGGWRDWKLYHRCSILAEKREWDRCLDCTKQLIDVLQSGSPGDMYWSWAHISFLARKGDFAAAEAELNALLSSVTDTTDARQMFDYWQSKAFIERERGNYLAACSAMDHIERKRWDIWNRYEYALACLGAGRLPEAIEQLETIVRTPLENKIFNVLRGARAIYYLGVAYEESGRLEEAAAQYERFLSLWRNADPGIDGLEDARNRLAVLRKNTTWRSAAQ